MRVLELEVGHPSPDPEVEVIQGHGADADSHLAGPGIGELDRLADEHLGAAVFSKDDGFGLHRGGDCNRSRGGIGCEARRFRRIAWRSG
jgi:hypothetical protein